MNVRENIPLLKSLAVFGTAARMGSFTAAARELNIAQSAVSRHVSNLEQYFSIALFQREHKRLVLTPSGQRLADAVTVGLGHIRSVLQELRRETQPATIVIGCSYDFASLWLMPRFGLLRAQLPGHDIRLVTSGNSACFDDEALDVSIRFGRRSDWPGLTAVHMFAEEAFPVCAPEFLATHPQLATGDPRGLPEVPLLYAEQRGIRWRDWFAQAKLPTPALHGPVFSNYMAVLYEALAGRGVALGWKHMLGRFVERGDLLRLTDIAVHSDWAFFAVHAHPAGSLQDRLANWFAAAVAAEVNDPLIVEFKNFD